MSTKSEEIDSAGCHFKIQNIFALLNDAEMMYWQVFPHSTVSRKCNNRCHFGNCVQLNAKLPAPRGIINTRVLHHLKTDQKPYSADFIYNMLHQIIVLENEAVFLQIIPTTDLSKCG